MLALYPSWWPGLADVFGRRIDAVRIDDNVICGGDEKVIYDGRLVRARPSGRGARGRARRARRRRSRRRARARLRGADPPGRLGGGRACSRSRTGSPRFDAGRIVPEGRAESFAIRASPAASGGVHRPRPAHRRRRRGRAPGDRRTQAAPSSPRREAALPARRRRPLARDPGPLGPVRGGDRVRVFALRGAFRDFHAWLLPEGADATPTHPDSRQFPALHGKSHPGAPCARRRARSVRRYAIPIGRALQGRGGSRTRRLRLRRARGARLRPAGPAAAARHRRAGDPAGRRAGRRRRHLPPRPLRHGGGPPPAAPAIGRHPSVHTAALTYLPGPGVPAIAEQLRALAAAVPQGARLHLVGHSLGGIVARYFALEAGDPRVVQTISLATPFGASPRPPGWVSTPAATSTRGAPCSAASSSTPRRRACRTCPSSPAPTTSSSAHLPRAARRRRAADGGARAQLAALRRRGRARGGGAGSWSDGGAGGRGSAGGRDGPHPPGPLSRCAGEGEAESSAETSAFPAPLAREAGEGTGVRGSQRALRRRAAASPSAASRPPSPKLVSVACPTAQLDPPSTLPPVPPVPPVVPAPPVPLVVPAPPVPPVVPAPPVPPVAMPHGQGAALMNFGGVRMPGRIVWSAEAPRVRSAVRAVRGSSREEAGDPERASCRCRRRAWPGRPEPPPARRCPCCRRSRSARGRSARWSSMSW